MFHWDLLFRTWRSKLMMIVFVYSSFHGSVLWFCIPFYFCSATKFATLYYKIQRPFPFYDIRMSKKFLQNFYNNSTILCIIMWILAHYIYTGDSLLKGTIQGKLQGKYHPNNISKKGWSWKHEKYFCGTKHKSLNRSMSSERK